MASDIVIGFMDFDINNSDIQIEWEFDELMLLWVGSSEIFCAFT